MGRFAAFGNDLHSGRRSFDIVGHRKIYYLVSILVIIGLAAITGVRGVNLGIEFRGGSEFQVAGVANPNEDIGRNIVDAQVPGQEPKVTVISGSTIRVQTERLDATQTEALRGKLASAYSVSSSEVTSSFIGPSWGADVTAKALRALIVFVILVMIVMAIYFRNFKSSFAAVIALLHDLLITAGVYGAVGFEITPAAVIGFLTILGYSLYDTVVVFDKVRENTVGLEKQTDATYGDLVNLANNQTIVRSINTSVVAVLPVGSILFIGAFILGAGTLRDISLALFIGIIAGTYSSIFVAPPLLVDLRHRESRVASHTKRVEARREAEAEQARLESERASAPAEPATAGSGQDRARGQREQPRRRGRS